MGNPYSNREIKFRNKSSGVVCVTAYLQNTAGEKLLTGCEYTLRAGEEKSMSQEKFYLACKEWLQKHKPSANIRIYSMKVVAYYKDRQDMASWTDIPRGKLQKHSSLRS